jgi:hypothetical protein
MQWEKYALLSCVGETEGRRPLLRPICRQYNMNIYVEEIGW